MTPKPFNLCKKAITGILVALIFSIVGCKKADSPAPPDQLSEFKTQKVKRLKNYSVRMLAANNSQYGAAHIIPTLQNAWGIAWSPTGIAWTGSEAGSVSNVMDSLGNPNPALNPVNIVSPTTATGGHPTGTVFNPVGTDFVIPSGNGTSAQGARFIFVGDDGVLSAWNGTWGHHTYRVTTNTNTFYSGLTMAGFNGNNYLYAANFSSGHIEVWDRTWTAVNWMSFEDPNLPAEYSPFNIQVVGDKLYVMYAKVGPGGDEEHAVGLGLVDVFTTGGIFVQRFATGGTLNAPWGAAMAPVEFYKDDEDSDAGPAILIGNFGDGHINAYRASNGKFLGQLSIHNTPVTIDGLWSLSFAPSTSSINHNLLYFTAGPADEQDGLFGYLSRDKDDD